MPAIRSGEILQWTIWGRVDVDMIDERKVQVGRQLLAAFK
jgi:hypothetical protein